MLRKSVKPGLLHWSPEQVEFFLRVAFNVVIDLELQECLLRGGGPVLSTHFCAVHESDRVDEWMRLCWMRRVAQRII